jgi:hypothetical protein
MRGRRPTRNLAVRDSRPGAETRREADAGSGWELPSVWGPVESGGECDTGGRGRCTKPAAEQKAGAEERSIENVQDVANRDTVLELLTPEAIPSAGSSVVAKPV